MNFTRSFIVIISVANLERVLNNVGKKPKIKRGSEKVLNVGTFQTFVYFKFQQRRQRVQILS